MYRISLRQFGSTKIIKRQCSTSTNVTLENNNFVDITKDDTTNIVTVSMKHKPVNSLNLEMLEALTSAFQTVSKSNSRGLILTSSLSTIFSAGLDINEMYKPNLQRLSRFWGALQTTWMTLYGLKLPVVAVINGSSPAGGCLLALSTDYRICIEGKHTIGLNETQLGIVAPQWFQNLYIATIGYRQAEIALMRGSLFSPKEALKIGLVDELATDKADAVTKCHTYLSSFKGIPEQAVAYTKVAMRKNLLEWLKNNAANDTNIFVNFIQTQQVQDRLHIYMKHLKKN